MVSKYQQLLDKYNARIDSVREIMTDPIFRDSMAGGNPDVDLAVELDKMIHWIVTAPRKSNKKQWLRFCTNWIRRCQKQGGNHGSYKRHDRGNRETKFDGVGEVIEL